MINVTPGALVGLVLLLSVLVGLGLVLLCQYLGRNLGAVDYPRGSTSEGLPVPRIGGLAIYVSAVLVLALAWLLSPTAGDLLDPLKGKLLGLGLGATMVLAMGLVDDVRGLRARWKLLGQILIALFIYYWGLRVVVVTNPFSPDAPFPLGNLEMPLNVLWVVLAMNAMNLIDGVDGLAGGVFLMAMILLLTVGLLSGQMGLSMVVAVLMGSALAFLRYNFNGSIFLGDGGSLLLGYLLAAFVPLFTPKAAGAAAAVIPVAVLSLPIAEVVMTSLRRVWKGSPIGEPDLGHAHHRMLTNGIKKHVVVFIIQGLSFMCGIIALVMTSVFNRPLAYLMAGLWLALVGLFLKIGYHTPRIRQTSNGSTSNPSIFLDQDRSLQRKIFKLKLADNRREIETRLKELGEDLSLVHLCCHIHRDGRVLEFSWPPETRPSSGETEYVVLTLKNGGGQVPPFELTAIVESSSFDQSWLRLINWLRGIASSLSQATDRLEQEDRPRTYLAG